MSSGDQNVIKHKTGAEADFRAGFFMLPVNLTATPKLSKSLPL
jgi:hypothetical protein